MPSRAASTLGMGARDLVTIPVIDVPLVIERGYRGVGNTKHSHALRRRVACACALSGCRRCALVGWVVRTETVDVQIPEGLHVGSTLRLPGQGDAIAPGALGDVSVEIVEAGERAEELRAAQRALETTISAEWERTRLVRLRERRQRWFGALGVLALVVVGTGSLFLKYHFDKIDIGSLCETDSDCQSGRCASFRRPLLLSESMQGGETLVTGTGPLARVAERRLCTDTCTRNTDCPPTMKCWSERATDLARGIAYPALSCVP